MRDTVVVSPDYEYGFIFVCVEGCEAPLVLILQTRGKNYQSFFWGMRIFFRKTGRAGWGSVILFS